MLEQLWEPMTVHLMVHNLVQSMVNLKELMMEYLLVAKLEMLLEVAKGCQKVLW